MASLLGGLQKLITGNNSSWLGQVLAGAGLGLASIAVFDTFITYYQDKAMNSFGQLGVVTGILGLAGLDKAISVIIGAYLASVYIKTFAAGLKVVKK